MAAAAVLAAASPIALILLLMLWRRWSAAKAGLAGLAVALLVALLAFELGGPVPVPVEARFHPLAGVLAEGAFLAASILWILLPALALHAHQQRIGAVATLRDGLAHLTADKPLQALAVGWFLALFLEGAAGFGTPIALTAPILVGLGYAPVTAVVLALLGHSTGVAFGALGTPVLAQAALSGLDVHALSRQTAILTAVTGSLMFVFFVRTLQAKREVGNGPGRVPMGWAVLAAAAFMLPYVAIATWLGPELPTLGGALVGVLAWGLLLRRFGAKTPGRPEPERRSGAGRALFRASLPYAVLVVLILLSRTVPAIVELSERTAIEWRLFGRFGARMQWLGHPGTLLLVALVLGARLQGSGLGELRTALAQAARRLAPAAVALLAMLCLSRLMLHAGMIGALETAAVQGLGQTWPLFAPFLGALGSFVTGSATASNVLFTSLQVQTAQALGASSTLILAGQGLGASVGNIVCPHNIVAGAATVGLAGREGEILRRTLPACAAVLAFSGVLLMLAVAWR